jgi:hypothetical protein
MISSQSSLLSKSASIAVKTWSPYFSVNVRARSQVIMGRFRLSLYVGRMTEYLSMRAIFMVVKKEEGNSIPEMERIKATKECIARAGVDCEALEMCPLPQFIAKL